MRRVHPIEASSLEMLRERVDLSHLPPLSRAVAERIVHATADVTWADDLVLDEAALRCAAAALQCGAPIVADVRMVAAGISTRDPLCAVDLASLDDGSTRSASGVRKAVASVGSGAVWVIGCAPTALEALLDARAEPAIVIGLPVGFVGAIDAKQRLQSSGLPAVTNRSERGGAAVAAAACNALLYADGAS